MCNKPFIVTRNILLLLFMSVAGSFAQTGDTLAAIRAFMQACQSYKQLPLQVAITMNCTANVFTTPGDSLHLEAAFYIDEHGSYTRMGEIEQVVNDSLMLLVSHQAHRMLLYTNNRSALSQMQSYMGFQLGDSSIAGLALRYTAAFAGQHGDSVRYELLSRSLLYGTSLPRESIKILYDAARRQPVEIVQLKRSLVPTDSSNYLHLQSMSGWAGKLLELPDRGWFVVKELTTSYRYGPVLHKKDSALPVRLPDRLAARSPGVYTPVKPYEDFILNQSTEQGMR